MGLIIDGYGFLQAGQKTSNRQVIAAASAPLPPGTPLHWYDFTDAATLFTDAQGTMAVSAHGNVILNVTDKGSAAEDLDTTVVTGPQYQTSGFAAMSAGSAGLFTDSEETMLSGVTESVVSIEACTYAIVFHPDNLSGNQMPLSWDGFDCSYLTDAQASLDSYVSNSEAISGTNGLVVETWYAAMTTCIEGQAADVEMYQSWTESEPATAAALDTDPAVDSSIAVGRSSASDLFHFDGYIGEVIYWNAVLNSTEIAAFKTYVTDKYGITWT